MKYKFKKIELCLLVAAAIEERQWELKSESYFFEKVTLKKIKQN